MDILSARKKAAEKANSRNKSESREQKTASAPPTAEEQAPVQALPEISESAPAPITNEAEPVEEGSSVEPTPSPEQSEESAAVYQEIEMLSFLLGDEEYAVMVEDVKEVLQVRDFTPVPNAPGYILGVTALRGPILPVIDLSLRLGLPDGVRDEKSRIVVVSADDEQAGLLVDRVTGVVRIPGDALRPVPETIEQGAEFLRGIARKGDRLFILLDIKKTVGV